ncbi:GT2 family glycosyltransferase [Chitinophaga skermanii]|uniref:GT2 family glycosyltransferase n=1 Tax=Chitinophaga skermanii TaxID=331697 RepID=A0A327QQY3_9BACT|nr:glycosyltransferase [Chitinophaga skermanii]RAJ07006.1 GT2 family glycosyltransferase [Chitinophaga skermanii]
MQQQVSIIIPIYNRPQEAEELLESLSLQTDRDFELVIVEDGSSIPCKDVCDRYANKLSISYYVKQNGGPGAARNYGMAHAKGNYFVILDSDCIIPPLYVETLKQKMAEGVTFYGGPDGTLPTFTLMQKAVNYSMTAFLTTGGIRGGKKKVATYFPRSFNMGFVKGLYEKIGGFINMYYGEDLDFSMRAIDNGFKAVLIPELHVYHKRRTSLKSFSRQVYRMGYARIIIARLHKGSLKLPHMAPTVFFLGLVLAVLLSLATCNAWWMAPFGLYAVLLFIDALIKNKSLPVAAVAVVAGFTQHISYGFGFIKALVQGARFKG